MLLSLLLATAAATSDAKPGTGTTPAMTCISTTIKESGHTFQSSIVASSGNERADRYALKVIRKFKFADEPGVKREPKAVLILMKTYSTGGFGYKIMERADPLLKYCEQPQAPEPKA